MSDDSAECCCNLFPEISQFNLLLCCCYIYSVSSFTNLCVVKIAFLFPFHFFHTCPHKSKDLM